MATIRGMDCEIFYNSGSYASPTWAAVDAVENADLEIEIEELDANRRGNNGWGSTEPGLKNGRLNVSFIKDKDDAAFVALVAAFQANPQTAVELVVYDGANASGSEGLDAVWRAISWNETQDLDGVVKIEAVYAPVSDDANIPTPLWISDALPVTR